MVHFFLQLSVQSHRWNIVPPEAGDGRVAVRVDPLAQDNAGERGQRWHTQGSVWTEAGKLVMTLEERKGSQVEAPRS